MTSAINDLAKLILAQMTQTEEGRKTQASIDSAMRGAIGDVRRGNPNQLDAPPIKTNVQTKWKEENPHRVYAAKGSFEEQLVDRMVEKFAGGPNSPVKE
jgi:hypothetical protein